MQEAVTDVASCGVISEPTTSSLLVGLSFITLARAANTASRYAITPIILAMIREILIYKKAENRREKLFSSHIVCRATKLSNCSK